MALKIIADVNFLICTTRDCNKHCVLWLFMTYLTMKDVLYEVRCLKSNEDMILALAGQFKQLN